MIYWIRWVIFKKEIVWIDFFFARYNGWSPGAFHKTFLNVHYPTHRQISLIAHAIRQQHHTNMSCHRSHFISDSFSVCCVRELNYFYRRFTAFSLWSLPDFSLSPSLSLTVLRICFGCCLELSECVVVAVRC